MESHISEKVSWFDLESPKDLMRLQNPELTLSKCRGWVVLDEIQRMPALFSVLRVLADRPDMPARFLILGSASPQIVRAASESLAGRVAFVDLSGFELAEVGAESQDQLWVRGGFPLSFFAKSDEDSFAWREDFIRTFLSTDLPALGLSVPTANIRRFWYMLAHYHGQTWNGSEVGRSLGLDHKTVSRYLDILSGAYLIRQLAPWFENISKRQVKAPKIYLRDPGLLHTLLGIHSEDELLTNPKLGASWEGFVLEQLMMQCPRTEVYFWGTYSGAEVDLLLRKGRGFIGIEVKRNEAPSVTPSMRSVVETLHLQELWVVYPGVESFALTERIMCHSLASALDLLRLKG
jgi:predicted AAA+ superfamily ATPase